MIRFIGLGGSALVARGRV